MPSSRVRMLTRDRPGCFRSTRWPIPPRKCDTLTLPGFWKMMDVGKSRSAGFAEESTIPSVKCRVTKLESIPREFSRCWRLLPLDKQAFARGVQTAQVNNIHCLPRLPIVLAEKRRTREKGTASISSPVPSPRRVIRMVRRSSGRRVARLSPSQSWISHVVGRHSGCGTCIPNRCRARGFGQSACGAWWFRSRSRPGRSGSR